MRDSSRGSDTRVALRGVALAIVAVLFLAAQVEAHTPIPTGTKRTFATNPATYRIVSSPGAWMTNATDESLETRFRDGNNNSRIPTLQRASGGTGVVEYRAASSSPCGTGNTLWLQCAQNSGADENWRIYVRNLTTSGPSGWTWWEAASTCGSNSGCWYMRRALIHELGHAMYAFPDMCLGGQPCRSESDTVMNSVDPEVGTTGSTNFSFQRCDEAAGQLDWDLANSAGEYGDCFDDISGSGTYGLKTNLTTTAGTIYACVGSSVTVSGRLEVLDSSSYGPLGANPLTNRTVRFDRNTTANFASTIASNASGNNWTKSFGSSTAGAYDFVAHFHRSSASGLDSSPERTFTVRWDFC